MIDEVDTFRLTRADFPDDDPTPILEDHCNCSSQQAALMGLFQLCSLRMVLSASKDKTADWFDEEKRQQMEKQADLMDRRNRVRTNAMMQQMFKIEDAKVWASILSHATTMTSSSRPKPIKRLRRNRKFVK